MPCKKHSFYYRLEVVDEFPDLSDDELLYEPTPAATATKSVEWVFNLQFVY